jgi:nicotinate-nucleotide pyrophosphorylase (carboxylating)
MFEDPSVETILRNAILEDVGNGDITSSAIIPEGHTSTAVLMANESFILAGVPFAERIFKLVNPDLAFKALKKDGSKVRKGTVIGRIRGDTRSILKAERVALNLLQRLSGIATLTSRFVESVKGFSVRIADTRKTTPGFRPFEKYAVRVGGGYNHRYGLFDGILIKDNHIDAAGGIGEAIRRARERTHHLLKIEIEVRNLRETKEALAAGADVIMLDNMPVDRMYKAVDLIHRKRPEVIIEASGGISLENVRSIASTGVDLISVGAITHSAPAVDISMEIIRPGQTQD